MNIMKILLATVLLAGMLFADATKVEKKLPAFMKMDDFKLKSVDGKSTHMLSKKTGYLFDDGKNKLTLMVVWSGQSKDSKKWLNEMQALMNANPDKVYVTALEIDGMPSSKIKAFAKDNKITFPMYAVAQNKDYAAQAIVKFQFHKKDKKTGKRGGVPFTLVFDYDGNMIYRGVGIVPKDEFEKYTQKLIEAFDKNSKKEVKK